MTNGTQELQAPADASLILVVDDEPSICWAFEKKFRAEGLEVLIASSAEEGLELAETRKPDLVLLDVRLPKEDGITALPKFVQQSDSAPVIVMTAFGDLDTAVSAMHNGASDYVTKPFDLDHVSSICRHALRHGRAPRSVLSGQTSKRRSQRLVGTSPAMQLVFKQIAMVATSDLSVLITGETGTGKELVAEAIHRNSHRSERPYVCVAPVALSEQLIESELFGHVAGAFTGAHRDRIGLFEQAENGTLFLDEMGELPLSAQVKLLRVLEQGEYCRVGDSTPRSCNVRVLAATNCDLHQAVSEGSFREDLYYRLNGLQMHLPPLSQRCEDIGPLCKYFLEQLNYPLHDAIDGQLLRELAQRPWHGNVRELRNAVQQAAVIARGRRLSIDDFPPAMPGRASSSREQKLDRWLSDWFQLQLAQAGTTTRLYHDFLTLAEPILFRLAMEATHNNRSKAADLLGIHRATLREKLKAASK